MKLNPLQDWAVIKKLDTEKRTAGGIIIPEIAKDEPTEGIVIAIGPGRFKTVKGKLKFIPTTLKPGQRVVYSQNTITEAELGNKVITLIREEDILGIYEEQQSGAVKHPPAAGRTTANKTKKKTGTKSAKPVSKEKSRTVKTTKKKIQKPAKKTAKKARAKKSPAKKQRR